MSILNNRELWLKNCADSKNYPYLLETNGNVELYQLKIIDNPDYNSYDHYYTTYHIWDKVKDKWIFTSTDYRTAYEKYKNRSKII